MRWWHALRARLALLFRRRAADSRMEEEFRLHVELETEANVRAGMAPAEARRRALVAFGGMERYGERMRDGRGAGWLDDLVADVRYALRRLRAAPGFASATIVTLGVGIGASAAIFNIVYGVLFRPLAYEEPERLVRLYRTSSTGGASTSHSPPNFMSLREETRSFVDVAVFDSEDVTLTGAGEARWLEGAEVSAGFFRVMGVQPILGRTFREGENLPGEDDVIVLGHALWQELGGRTGIVGRTLQIHERARTVVGVLPAGFDFPYESDVWVPLQYDEGFSAGSTGDRRSFWLNTIARLRDGVTLDAARADLALLADRLQERFPEGNRDVGFDLRPLRDSLAGPARPILLLLLGAVGLLLLIACTNVAGLFLARAASRREEMAVRGAIGAGRGRLIRQLMTESLVMGALGGLLGLLVTIWGTRLFVAAPPAGMPRMDAVRVDAAVLVFGTGVTLLAALLTGLVPAFQATRTSRAAALREGGRSAVVRGGARMRAVLVAAEIALAVVLLAGAGLLTRSLTRIASADPGFRPEGGLTFLVRLPDSYQADPARIAYFDELLQRLRSLAAVDAAAAVHRLPMAWNGFGTRVRGVEGRAPFAPEQQPSITYRSVTPGFFQMMGIPVLAGRDFTPGDRDGSLAVAIINETAARRLFPGQDAVGRRVTVGASDSELTIAGVVGDVVDYRFYEIQEPAIFLPYAQATQSYMSVVVRATGDPRSLLPSLRGALNNTDPNVPGREFRTLENVVHDSIARERFLSSLSSAFAAAALLLAATGIFGLLSFTVAERQRELAVRSALGARRTTLIGMVLHDAARLVAAGLVIGIALAVATGRVLRSLLYQVSALDATTFAAVTGALALTAIIASLIPARRAATVDPMTALRRE